MDQSDRPGVVAPPPVIYFFGGGIGWLVDQALPWPILPHPARWLGAGLGLIAILWALWAVWAMRSAGTHIDPSRPALHLVRSGPFRWTRNPIYLALSASLLAFALATNNGWAALMMVPVILVMQRGVIRREERYLEAKFGEQYRQYLTEVRRWL